MIVSLTPENKIALTKMAAKEGRDVSTLANALIQWALGREKREAEEEARREAEKLLVELERRLDCDRGMTPYADSSSG